MRAVLSRVAVASGITHLGRRLRDHDGTIVLYGHRVAADDEGYLQGLRPEWLREQLRYLTRHYEIIPLETLVECLEQRKPPPPRSVVLTFDDGFRDNVEVALPILESFGVTATIFVVTQSLTDGRLPWSQRLGYAFQHAQVASVRHRWLGDEGVPVGTSQERRRAYATIKRCLAPAPRSDRDAAIDELARALAVDVPSDRMMTWEHARDALSRGFAIGAHTFSHALLALVPEGEAHEEMERSREDLAQHLDIRTPSFCFPGGSTNRRLLAFAREAGFRSAFRPNRHRRVNRPPLSDPFDMARMGLPNAPAHHLESELEGPFHAARLLAGRYRGTEVG